jgi:hypothetical protein
MIVLYDKQCLLIQQNSGIPWNIKNLFLPLHGGRMWSRPLNGEHELQVLDNKSVQENIWM